MYKIIYRDNRKAAHTVYSPLNPDFQILTGKYHRELNTAGSLTFTLKKTHPLYTVMEGFVGEVELYYKNKLLFKARPLNPTFDFYGNKTFECEGLLAYLNDSSILPYEFSEKRKIFINSVQEASPTIRLFFKDLILEHNSQVTDKQKFLFVDATGSDALDEKFTASNISDSTAWAELSSKIINNIGGYIDIEYGNGDYDDEDAGYNKIVYTSVKKNKSAQQARYAVNLKDLNIGSDDGSFATAIRPFSTYTNSAGGVVKLTIDSVNNNNGFVVDNAAVEKYGRINRTVTYEGLWSADYLKILGQYELEWALKRRPTINASFIDMSALSDDYDPLEIGELVRAVSASSGINEELLLTAFDVDLLNTGNSTYTFNNLPLSFIGKTMIKEMKR